MPNQKGFTQLVIIASILLLIILGSAYYFYRSKNKLPQNQSYPNDNWADLPFKKTISPQSTQSAELMTDINKLITFKLPTGWKEIDNLNPPIQYITLSSADSQYTAQPQLTSGADIYIQREYNGETLQDPNAYIKTSLIGGMDPYQQQKPDSLEKYIVPIKIDGLEGFKNSGYGHYQNFMVIQNNAIWLVQYQCMSSCATHDQERDNFINSIHFK